jgi:hypothetical protein
MSLSAKTPINVTGEIISGEMKGWFVRVEEADEGGAYLILQSKRADFKAGLGGGYDDWVLPEDLDFYFEAKGWDIRWS